MFGNTGPKPSDSFLRVILQRYLTCVEVTDEPEAGATLPELCLLMCIKLSSDTSCTWLFMM